MGLLRRRRHPHHLEPGVDGGVPVRRSTPEPEAGSSWAASLTISAFLMLASAFAILVGRPLFTDDAWWHLALGRAFAAQGPWLEADPLLHTSSAPPVPAAWLSDVLLYAASLPFGVVGLRVLHVLIVAAILAGAWLALRRQSHARSVASFGTALFLVFSAYRLSQLRPELATILACIALYVGLLQRRDVPSWTRVGGGAMLCGFWANLHPAFPLGPALIAAASFGSFAELWLRGAVRDSGLRERAWRLGWATLLAIGATFVNPMGGRAHLLYFGAGEEGPAVTLVADEWAPLDPFRLPVANMPPSPLVWLAFWVLAIATLCVVTVGLVRWRRDEDGRAGLANLDGALLPLALLGILAPLFAVRFLWLSLFPLLLLASAISRALEMRPKAHWVLASLALLLIPASHRFGDWPLLSSGVSRFTYLDPYDRWKYHGHAARFLRDSELEGNLYNSYFMGGFLGYWLSPRLRVFIDGSLHVSPQTMTDYFALQLNADGSRDFDATALLDRYGVDAYVGIGFPTPRLPNRPWRYTSRHLEGAPDWTLVFRSMQSAVYLRRNERNRENLLRIQRHYADAGVPFDPETGIDVARIVDEVPDRAIRDGLVPRHFEHLLHASQSESVQTRALNQLSPAYLALGLDERALEVDSQLLSLMPTAAAPRRRRLGALLRLDRVEQALAEAEALARLQARDSVSLGLIEAARRYAGLEPEERRVERSRLAVLTRAEASRLRASRAVSTPLSARRRTKRIVDVAVWGRNMDFE